MKYVVVWPDEIAQELAAVWLAAADPSASAASTHRLEQLLERDPLHTGESRGSSVNRVAFDRPVGIAFEVVEDDKRVVVRNVFLIQ